MDFIFLTAKESITGSLAVSSIQVDKAGSTNFINDDYTFLTEKHDSTAGAWLDSKQVDITGNHVFINPDYLFFADLSGPGNPITVVTGKSPRMYGYIAGG